MYLARHMEKTLRKAAGQSKIVLLTGARQVGKTTAMRQTFPAYQYLTLDDENELRLALEDRALFFRDRRFPLIIDEIQYAKELLRTVKQRVDRSGEKGQIFLTGSQTYELMSAAAESLAGRVSILELSSLSMRERLGIDFSEPFLPAEHYCRRREAALPHYEDIWSKIHRGAMPELLDEERDGEWFYRDYVRTYLERDVRHIVNVRDELKFRQFLVSLAARSGQILVYADVARDVGIDIKTVQQWLSVVNASGLIKLLRPYQNNAIKRAIKSPKLYFMDTGLLCYLVGWNTPRSAQNGAMSGSIFETFVVSEILKSWLNAGRDLSGIFYYRDGEKREIDLLLEEDNALYPVEIKKSGTVQRSWGKAFAALPDIPGKEIMSASVLCGAEQITAVTEGVRALPITYI